MSALDILSTEECRLIVQSYLQTDDFKDVTVEIKPLEGAITGFMSEHFKVRLQVVLGDKSIEELKFFAKIVPRNVPLHKAYVEDSGAYFKETSFYSKIVPGLEQYLAERQDGNQSYRKHRWAPQCFLTRSDIVVLQDLSAYNFKLCSNRELLDRRHCEVVLKEAANFHAASIILEEKHAQKFGKYSRISELYPVVFDETITTSLTVDESKGWFSAGVKSLLPLLDLLPKYKDNPKLRNVIRSKLPVACKRLEVLVGSSNKYRNAVCHGDLWTNNILFQYNDRGDPVEARFVDFQLVRYTPPAHDVMCFLHCTTDKAFRDAHLEEMMTVYYDAFSSELKRNGLDPERLLSWTEFKESCHYLKELAIITSVLYFQMTLLKAEIVAPIFADPSKFNEFMLTDRSAEVCESFVNDEYYRNNLNEAMEELIENFILREK